MSNHRNALFLVFAMGALGCADTPRRVVPIVDAGVSSDAALDPMLIGRQKYTGPCVQFPGGGLRGYGLDVMIMSSADGGTAPSVASFATSLGTNFDGGVGNDFYRLFTVGAPLSVERRYIALGTGTNTALSTCSVCALLYIGCTSGVCQHTYFPRSGVAYIEKQPAASGDQYIAKIAAVEFYPVTVDESAPSANPATTPVEPACIYVPFITIGAIAQTPGQDGGNQFTDTLDLSILRTVSSRPN